MPHSTDESRPGPDDDADTGKRASGSPDKPPASDAASAADGPAAGPADLGVVSAAYRILPPSVEPDRTLLIALGLVLLLHAGWGMSMVLPSPLAPAATDDKRRGQVDLSTAITVELVENPDARSRSDRSQLGETKDPSPEIAAEDVPQRPADGDAEAQPPAARPKSADEAKSGQEPQTALALPGAEADKRTPRPAEAELSLDDFDVTMDAYARAVEAAQAERQRQRTSRATPPAIKGAAPQGEQSAYAKSVIAALAKTKPRSYLTRGDVYVQFEIELSGAIRWIRIMQSSNDPLMDQLAVDAIKAARFSPPPPGVDPRDLRYVIHYKFD